VSICEISCFRHGVDEIFVLGCYAADVGSCLQTFRDNLLVPSSKGPAVQDECRESANQKGGAQVDVPRSVWPSSGSATDA
jgi:hypothetical protein